MPRSVVAVALLVATLRVAPAATTPEASPAALPEAMAGLSREPLGLGDVLPGLVVPVVRVA